MWLEFSEFKLRPRVSITPLEIEVDERAHLQAQLIKSCGFELRCEALIPEHQCYVWSIAYRDTIIVQQMGSGASGAKRAVEKMLRDFNVPKALEIKRERDAYHNAGDLLLELEHNNHG